MFFRNIGILVTTFVLCFMDNIEAQLYIQAGCGAPRCVNNNGNGAYTWCGKTCNATSPCDVDETCKSNSQLEFEAAAANYTYSDPCCSNALCFSSFASTHVRTKGKTFIKDLQIGDEVLTASGGYKQVYTIVHKHPHKASEFLQIYTSENEEASPLEITNNHLVFLHNKKEPVPAGKLQVGDSLQVVSGQPAVVTKISSAIRDGLWNPITEDGTIVVDGIITSTYTALNLFSNGNTHSVYLEVGGYKLISMHDFIHLLMTPYRTVCINTSSSFCDVADNEEFSPYSKFGNQLLKVSEQLHPMIQNSIAISTILLFSGLHILFMNPLAIAVLSASGAYFYNYTTKSSSQKQFQ